MILGIGFRAKSGKDLIADILVKKHGFKKIAFADSLKEACRQIFSFNDEQLYGNLKEVVDPYWQVTPRYVLQKVGTECMRDGFDKDVWIKSVEKKIIQGGNWVISDVRFPNEAEAIHRFGGFLVRVDRIASGACGGIVSHSSEISMNNFSKWDYILDNNIEGLEALRGNVEEMLNYFKKRMQ